MENLQTEPCTIDITNKRDVRLHLRDLINIGPMLETDYEEEIFKFMKKAKEAGWAEEILEEILEQACDYTIYEHQLPSKLYGFKTIKKKKATKESDYSLFQRKGAWAG